MHVPHHHPVRAQAPEFAPPHWTHNVGTLLARVLVPAWILAGAAFKLMERDPRLLPQPVTTVTDAIFVEGLGYAREAYLAPALRGIIAIEIGAALAMLLAPRIARLLGIGFMGLFCVILTMLITSGAASCGCFGKSGPPPSAMLAIDGVLLLGLLFFAPRRTAQPWSHALGIAAAGLVVGAAVAFSVPEKAAIALPAGGPEDGAPMTASAPAGGVTAPPTPPDTTPSTPPRVDPPKGPESPTTPPAAAAPAPWPAGPASAKPWYAPEFDKWIGKRLDAQEFALLITRPLPINPNQGRLHIVFIREDCDHCHALLNSYFTGPLQTPTLTVVVPDATGELLENPCTECKKATLPAAGITWVFSTPVLLTVEDGIVLAACTEVEDPVKVRAALNARPAGAAAAQEPSK